MIINSIPFEDDEHIAFVDWFERQYPHIELIHIANGELRDSNRVRGLFAARN